MKEEDGFQSKRSSKSNKFLCVAPNRCIPLLKNLELKTSRIKMPQLIFIDEQFRGLRIKTKDYTYVKPLKKKIN